MTDSAKNKVFSIIKVNIPFYGDSFYLTGCATSPYLCSQAEGPFSSEDAARIHFHEHRKSIDHTLDGPVIQARHFEEKQTLWEHTKAMGSLFFSLPLDEFTERFERGPVQGPEGEALKEDFSASFKYDCDTLEVKSSSLELEGLCCAYKGKTQLGSDDLYVRFAVQLGLQLYAPKPLPGKFKNYVQHYLKAAVALPAIGEDSVEADILIATPW